jgi:hypothetical protein
MSGSGDQISSFGGSGEEQLFDDIREFLSVQSGDKVYEELAKAYAAAQTFVDRELRDLDEFGLMLRGLERLVDDIFEDPVPEPLRGKLAEVLYLYGLAHYSLLQQTVGTHAHAAAEDDDEDTAAPLVIYDIWFPSDVAIERAQDGLYLHVSDGRIDLSIYLGDTPNERGALVDLVDHWGYAASHTEPLERDADLSNSVPMLTIEIDYSGSELVDAHDHVDVLFFDDEGEPVVRMHARASDLRGMIDELQAADRDGGL